MGPTAESEVPEQLSELRRSGELALSVLASLAQTCVLVFDHELRYVLCAGAALAQHGLEPAVMEGRTLRELVPPRRLPELLPHYRAALQGFHPSFVLEARGRCYDVDVVPVTEGGRILGGLVVARDTTERTRAERALAARERDFRRLAEEAGDVISRTDAAGVYRYVSPASARVYGWAPEELVGRYAREFAHPDDVAAHAALREELRAGTATHTGEFRVRHKDGHWVWVELRYTALRGPDGRLEAVQAAARDITDRKAAEAARQVADQQFQTAFDGAPIGMALVRLTGELLRVNDALCTFLDRPAEDLLEQTITSLTHPDDLRADLELMDATLDGARSSYRIEKRYLRPDGTVVWGELSVSLVRDDAGAPLHFVSQIQDITGRRRLEADLHRLASHDELTGLHNRRHFQRELARRLAGSAGPGSVLVLLDLDGFKAVNDEFGHVGGDLVLRHVADVLRAAVQEGDCVARLGGDEFALLLAHGDGRELAETARRLRERLAAAPLVLDGTEVVVRASVGAAPLDHLRSGEATLRAADAAMYTAKRSRRAR